MVFYCRIWIRFFYSGTSDVDPDGLYADPDPQNLMNKDPGKKITKLIFEKKKSNLYLNLRD